jgi:hypothetical protein
MAVGKVGKWPLDPDVSYPEPPQVAKAPAPPSAPTPEPQQVAKAAPQEASAPTVYGDEGNGGGDGGGGGGIGKAPAPTMPEFDPASIFGAFGDVPKMLAPTTPDAAANQTPGNCPPGQVWRSDFKGAYGSDKPGCEPEDWRSKNDQDTCLSAPPSNCPASQTWCDFTTATWKCGGGDGQGHSGMWNGGGGARGVGGSGGGAGKPDPDWAYNKGQLLKYGHATVHSSGILFNVGTGNENDSSTWSECWNPDTGAKSACPPGLQYEGPGGAGGSGGSGSGGAGGQAGFAGKLEATLKQLLDSPSRYTPEALQKLLGEITRNSSNTIARGERGVRDEAARMGRGRWGSTSSAIQAVRAGAEQQRGQAEVGVLTNKINTDFQDKMAGIDRAQKYLDSLRDSEYRWALMGEQRKQFDANLALAYANAAQQKAALQMQLQSQWDMLNSNQAFQLLQQSVR